MSGKAFWGPSFWIVKHFVALHSKNKDDYKRLVQFYIQLLPCEMCKTHYVKNLEKYPVELYTKSNESLFYHSFVLHDLVNKTKKPPSSSPSFDEAKRIYSNMKFEYYEKNVWHVLLTLSALVKDSTARVYRDFMFLLIQTIPPAFRKNYETFLRAYSPDAYLRNNKDAFFYTYLFYSHISSAKGMPAFPYLKTKAFYFSGVGEECSDCKT